MTNARWKRYGRWAAIPLATWLVAELAVGAFFRRESRWYERAIADLETGPPAKTLFLGSSRVNAAIDETAAQTETGSRALNLGMGYSTTTTHYLGLRSLLDKRANQLKGATLFIEAPGGWPDARTWRDPWADATPGGVFPYIRTGDLPAVWQTTDSFENKVQITIRTALGFSNILTRKDKVQQYALKANDEILAPRLAGQGANPAKLTGDGGIRVDPEALTEVRRIAEATVTEEMREPVPLVDWNRTVLADLVRMVKAHDGRVVFFYPPMAPTMARPYDRPESLAAAAKFVGVAQTWGSPVVHAPFASTDADYPDLWHLRRDRAAEFTRLLLQTLAKSETVEK